MALILLVDDEEPVRHFLRILMTDAGHRTVEAAHGAAALDRIREERPDLVIADVMMPVLDGTDLCCRLKAGRDTRSIPVILMSAARSPEGEACADAFVAKPFDLEAMEALVGHWLLAGPALRA